MAKRYGHFGPPAYSRRAVDHSGGCPGGGLAPKLKRRVTRDDGGGARSGQDQSRAATEPAPTAARRRGWRWHGRSVQPPLLLVRPARATVMRARGDTTASPSGNWPLRQSTQPGARRLPPKPSPVTVANGAAEGRWSVSSRQAVDGMGWHWWAAGMRVGNPFEARPAWAPVKRWPGPGPMSRPIKARLDCPPTALCLPCLR
ncbi:MAG: hypothetical protein M1821_008780 [Bathelium mastoideum]|nr:MAG: hypothetical protein M1821_008780 [Bathelium mastoideum]